MLSPSGIRVAGQIRVRTTVQSRRATNIKSQTGFQVSSLVQRGRWGGVLGKRKVPPLPSYRFELGILHGDGFRRFKVSLKQKEKNLSN